VKIIVGEYFGMEITHRHGCLNSLAIYDRDL
jgi:hypothetical protein